MKTTGPSPKQAQSGYKQKYKRRKHSDWPKKALHMRLSNYPPSGTSEYIYGTQFGFQPLSGYFQPNRNRALSPLTTPSECAMARAWEALEPHRVYGWAAARAEEGRGGRFMASKPKHIPGTRGKAI